jgi:hypothetical protein
MASARIGCNAGGELEEALTQGEFRVLEKRPYAAEPGERFSQKASVGMVERNENASAGDGALSRLS